MNLGQVTLNTGTFYWALNKITNSLAVVPLLYSKGMYLEGKIWLCTYFN